MTWPHRYLEAEVDAGRIDARTVICVLTHDPKFDVPVLEIALRLPEVAYVGAMGSRRTHEDRIERLREAGLTDDELARLLEPDRARPRRAHARGDRGQHRGRDHRPAVGRPGRTPGPPGRADPPPRAGAGGRHDGLGGGGRKPPGLTVATTWHGGKYREVPCAPSRSVGTHFVTER